MHSPLISAPALHQQLQSAHPPVVLDCRFNLADADAGRAAWAQDHLPGALYVHLDHDLSGPRTGHNGRHPLPDRDAFIQRLNGWGIQPGRLVVCLDAQGGMFAARAWWMLHWAGHAQVQVLDGGWPAWCEWQEWQARPTADATAPRAEAAPAPLAPTPTSPATCTPVRWDEVLKAVAAPTEQTLPQQLLDARAPDRFRGENETLDPVGGHIPGARNHFFQHNLRPDGRFKAPDELRSAFVALLGDTPASQVVHQCGSGVTACHNLLAMEVAGMPGSRLYAGSWSEWCADPRRPMQRG